MSIGIRISARIEHSATPITMTTMEIGLRSAARRSHMAMVLLVSCRGVIAEKAQGRLGRRQLKRDSAKQPAAPKRHQFPPARENFARRKRRRESRGQLDNERAPGLQLYAQLPVREEYSRRLFWHRRGRLVLCVVVLSGLAKLGRSAPALRVRSLLPQPSST